MFNVVCWLSLFWEHICPELCVPIIICQIDDHLIFPYKCKVNNYPTPLHRLHSAILVTYSLIIRIIHLGIIVIPPVLSLKLVKCATFTVRNDEWLEIYFLFCSFCCLVLLSRHTVYCSETTACRQRQRDPCPSLSHSLQHLHLQV